MWGCKKHWFMLPRGLRQRIWATYRPGQEIEKNPSARYLHAANEVQAWIAKQKPADVHETGYPAVERAMGPWWGRR